MVKPLDPNDTLDWGTILQHRREEAAARVYAAAKAYNAAVEEAKKIPGVTVRAFEAGHFDGMLKTVVQWVLPGEG